MDSVSADWPGDGVSFTFDADAADSTDLADAIDLDVEAADADTAEIWKTGRLRNRWWGQPAPSPPYLPAVSIDSLSHDPSRGAQLAPISPPIFLL